MDVKGIIYGFLGIIVVFYLLSALLQPTESATIAVTTALNGTVTGESLGTGPGAYYTSYHPIKTGTDKVYNDSTQLTRNSDYTINYNTGLVNITNTNATGTITIDYIREAYAEELSSTPEVAYLIALLSVLTGITYYAWRQ
jgi:hypothetical protein